MRKRGGFNFELRNQDMDFDNNKNVKIAKRGNDPDFLFYNAQIINNSTATTQKYDDPEIAYQDTRTVPILEDKSKYAISVENFTINGAGKNLPIFIPQIREYNIDGSLNRNPNNTVYDIIFTAQYGGTKTTPELVYQSTRAIQWEPELKASWTDTPVPLPMYKYPQPEIPYYYCYTYSHWLKLVNSTLALAWADVKAAALAGGVPGLTIVINSLNGTFTKGGLVQNLETGGTAFVVSFTGGLTNTLILYNITGDFGAGDTIFQEPDVGTARISTVSTAASVSVPAVELGTKCPFFTYDPKTNLFSLHQDANTCLTPFGSNVSQEPFNSTNPPNALNVFGSSTASGYVSGEYSFVGYNTNFEGLFTNFNTTYYSDQIPYPSIGSLGISITSPLGTESVDQATAVVVDEGQIDGFAGDQMYVSWLGSPGNVAGSNWKFGMPEFSVSSSTGTPSVGDSYSVAGSLYASYLKPGVLVQLTKTNVPTTKIVGQITSVTGSNPITNLVLKVKSLTTGASSTSWFLTTLTMNSDTDALPIAGRSISLVTDLGPGESVIQVNHAVTASGPGGQSFDGLVSSFQETLGYTGATGGGNEFLIYKDATLLDGFNPIASYEAQDGKFEVGNVVRGLSSAATAQVVEILAENSGDPNTISVLNQTGTFQINDTITVLNGSAVVTDIEGPNLPTNIVRNGILSIRPTYSIQTQEAYAGPFSIGDKVTLVGDNTSSAIITEIDGDNGYTTLTYSSQKNPFVIGHTIDCFISLNDTTNSVCSGKIVDIIGDNLGYGTVNVSNQNGQFGIGEQIVNNYDNSVATIVSIEGTNNGYGTVSYINQTTTGAPGSFVSDEFLLFASNQVAFAKVIIDKQNVMNQTEGNIGSVTVITGVEIDGVFIPTSNILLPVIGEQILGSHSGTIADYGGIVYLESCTLTVNNIVGKFNVGDTIVDNVGFGIANSRETISVTATCNGFSYLGNGKLIIKNSAAGISEPAQFPTNSFIVDIESATPPTQTNTISANVINVTPNRQFINGDPIQGVSSGALGTVIANCGSFPYPSSDPTNQLLTILPNKGSAAFIEGEQLLDTKPAVTLNNVALGLTTGSFNVGDSVSALNPQTSIQNINVLPNNKVEITLSASRTINVGTNVKGLTSGALGTVLSGSGTSYTLENVDGTFANSENIRWTVASGYVYIPTPDRFSTTNLILTNISGTFPNTLTEIQNNTPVCAVTVTNSIVGGYNSVTYNIAGFPTSGNQFFNWNRKQELCYCTFKRTVIPFPITIDNVFMVIPYTDPEVNDYIALDLLNYSGGFITPFASKLIVNKQSIGTAWGVGVYVRTWNGSSLDGGDPSQGGGIIINVEPLEGGQYMLDIVWAYWQDVSGSGGTKGIQGTSVSINGTPDLNGGTPWNGSMAAITEIVNYSSTGCRISQILGNPYYGNTNYSTALSGADTEGTILNLNISSSNAFVQTSKPPQNITALKVTNIQGNFPIDGVVIDTDQTPSSYGEIQSFSETTDYSETLTTLNVKNVEGNTNFNSGDTITFQTNKTATIRSTTFQNGSLMLKATNNISFQNGEFITDLGTTATATLTSTPQPQTIVGLTSGTTANVLLDKNSQLKLGNIVGSGFDTEEQIQSSAGTLAEIEDTSYFGIGNLVTTSTGQGTIVSDNGTELVINNVSGIFTPTQTLTSVYEGVTTTATLVSLDNPIMIIIPTNSTGQSSSWTIVPQTLTSSTTVLPSSGSDQFTTNLTIDETIFDVGDKLHVIETIPTLTLEQLYYPENVVKVDLSAGNAVIETLQSVFPSSTSGSQYVILTQDYESTSSLWSPIASIVVGTQFITVRGEYSGTPITIGTGNLGGNASAGSFQQVLLETPIDVLPQESWRGLINYSPKVETLSSLGLSKEEVKNLDVKLYWRNRLTNSLIPLTLYNSGSANIRLLFKRIRE